MPIIAKVIEKSIWITLKKCNLYFVIEIHFKSNWSNSVNSPHLFTSRIYAWVQNPDMTAMSTLVLFIYFYCSCCRIFVDIQSQGKTECKCKTTRTHLSTLLLLTYLIFLPCLGFWTLSRPAASTRPFSTPTSKRFCGLCVRRAFSLIHTTCFLTVKIEKYSRSGNVYRSTKLAHVTWTSLSRSTGQRFTCRGRGRILAASRTAC